MKKFEFAHIAEGMARQAGSLLRGFYEKGVTTEYKGDDTERREKKEWIPRLSTVSLSIRKDGHARLQVDVRPIDGPPGHAPGVQHAPDRLSSDQESTLYPRQQPALRQPHRL